MRIIHLIRPEDPSWLRRHQELDASILAATHEVETCHLHGAKVVRSTSAGRVPLADVVRSFQPALLHIYTSHLPSNATLRTLAVPWIAPSAPSDDWFGLRKAPEPDLVRSPHPAIGLTDTLPEAAERPFFDLKEAPATPSVGGIVNDESARSFFDAVRARISRTREDVRWLPFQGRPSPGALSEVGVWVDFGTTADDGDEFIPNALVAGRIVVAPRNDLNSARLLGGEAGFLVPAGDPNEMAHVIVTALFKPEITAPRVLAARASRDRFDPALRARLIEQAYERVVEGARG